MSTEPATLAPPRPKWRADIEGLRGIAVLLVCLYHAGIPGFSGGFIGVDVFFVLSGYLITGILVGEAERTGRIDVARFFSRRARRLLPAVILMLLAVLAFSYTFLSPNEQIPTARTAVATALYFSNIHFGLEATDYLAADAETNPLLHTWSLSVEEQFYIVWPFLVLWAMAGLRGGAGGSRRRLVAMMSAVSAAAFVGTLLLMRADHQHWAFFASPVRAWEFALGGIAAMVWLPDNGTSRFAGLTFRGRPVPPSALAVALGWVGLAVVMATGMLYTGRTPFPGWAAVLPVVGTALALRAGTASETSSLARFLSLPPLQLFGRLSYSWYLWHWPVLVLAPELFGRLSGIERLGLLAVALLFAELSYRFVENPIRRLPALAGRPRLGLVFLAALTAFSSLTMWAWLRTADEAARSPEFMRLTEAMSNPPTPAPLRPCSQAFAEAGYSECSLGPAAADTTLFLIGDSHAQDLLPPLLEVAEARGWRLVAAMKPGCAPWYVDERFTKRSRGCEAWREQAFERVKAVAPDLLILKGTGESFRQGPKAWRAAADSAYGAVSPYAAAVVDFRDFPLGPGSPSLCLARATWRGTDADCSVPIPDAPPGWTGRTRAADNYANVRTIDFIPELCPDGRCPTEINGEIVYRDRGHLGKPFAMTLAPVLERAALDAMRPRAAGPSAAAVTSEL